MDADTAATTADAAHMGHERHREAEMEARGVAHVRVAGGQVGVDRERRLHKGEGRDDDAPDALGGIERQDAFVAIDQAAHHVGLARGAEGGAGFLRLLDRDQPVDDLAALHQEAVHGLVDAVDVAPQIGERRCFRAGRLDHDDVSTGRIDRSREARNQRKR